MVNEQNIQQFSDKSKQIFEQIRRDVVGQTEIIENTIIFYSPSYYTLA